MKAAVVVFPGSNCDRDMAVALTKVSSQKVEMVWHKEASLPKGLDIVAIPGGFSFGDYLRCGAIAARSPICRAIVDFAARGGYVLGVCNGFQVLTETALLPGVLMRNSGLKFICKDIDIEVTTTASPFTSAYGNGQKIRVPIAHHDGNYRLPEAELARLQDQDRIAFTYERNPNGSMWGIAGVLSKNRRVLGMMPHPERLNDRDLGGEDGCALFDGLAASFAAV